MINELHCTIMVKSVGKATVRFTLPLLSAQPPPQPPPQPQPPPSISLSLGLKELTTILPHPPFEGQLV